MERIISQDFKETEIGHIPKDWKVTRLGDINQSIKSSLIPSDFPDEDFEYYSIPAYQDKKKPTIQKGSSILSLKLVLQNDTVLFGKLNPRVEKVWVVSSESPLRKIGSTEWLPIIPNKDKAISNFIYFLEFSNYVMPKAKELVSGSTPSRQRVDPTSFYRISIPLPPIPEQTAIANVLSTVQENIEKTENLINSTKELKKSLMSHLFTYGPVPINEAEKVKLKETEVGLIPEDWEVRRLGDIITLQRGVDLPLSKREQGKYPVVGSNGITGYHSKFFTEGPGVLVGRSGSVGKVTWIERDYWPLNTSLWIKEFHSNNKKFIYYLLNFIDLSKYSSGVSVPTLNRNLVHPINLGVPSLPEQTQIADILSTVDAKIEAEENKARALEKLFQSLLNDLMTGKIRVREELS